MDNAESITEEGPTADVVSLDFSGEPGAYTFSVGIRSDETGCEQYADWWEVLSSDGLLLYRRVLDHSHPDEQPFVRSGGPIPVHPEQDIILRAHLNNVGYGGRGLSGRLESGLVAISIDPSFSADLVTLQPLPTGCLF